MKRQFRRTNFRPSTLAIIEQADEFINEFDGQKLSLRQLYYLFISRDLFPESWIDRKYNLEHGLDPETKNTIKNYTRLGGIVTDARYAGLLDWDAIEDRNRESVIPLQFNNLQDRVEAALNNYRLPRWANQEFYAELWVEKAALAGVLGPLAREYHVTLMVNKGYSSASAMYEAAERFLENMFASEDGLAAFHDWEDRINADERLYDKTDPEYKKAMDHYIAEYSSIRKHKPVLFYLGDHDPSGEDMVRDIGDRLKEFGVHGLRVEKVALTMKQIKRYNPPPNPAKLTDSRAKKYIEQHGTSSWEVDALPPRVLTQIIRSSFESVLDAKKMNAVMKQEEQDKNRLRKALENL